jgi:hypothetical protein
MRPSQASRSGRNDQGVRRIFWTIKFGGFSKIDWLVPIFVMTTIFTLGTGPAQTVLAWRLAHRDIRRHGSWFLYYLVMSILFYTAF